MSNKVRPISANLLKEKVPPHAYDAECAVIGGVMLDPDAFERLEGSLLPEHFYAEANRLIFAVIQDLTAQGMPIDALTIKDHLTQRNQLSDVGGEAYLGELIEAVPTAANINHYAQLVRERAILRELLSASGKISQEIYEQRDKPVGEHLDKAEQNILAVAERFQRARPTFSRMNTLMVETYKHLEARYADKRAITGIATGFTDLDEMTSGLQRDDLVIIAGRPSMGKTAFAIDVARNSAFEVDGKEAVAVFSLEMSCQQIAMRMLASEARIDMQNLRTGRFSRTDWSKLAAATGSLAEAAIFVDDTPAISILEIRSKCRRLKREAGGLAMVVIDYLQLMTGRANAERRDLEISEITRSLKGLAKELHVPVVVLSQLSRAVESRADKRPMMSDLRESGAIEQDADVIMFIHRKEMYNNSPENEGMAELIVAKQRNGPIGDIQLTFIKKFTRFENFSGRPAFDE